MKYHGVMKALALILCVVSLVALVASTFGLAVAIHMDLYRQDVDSYIEDNQSYDAERYASDLAAKYASRVFGGCTQELLEQYYNVRWTNVWDPEKIEYALLDTKDNVLEGSLLTEGFDSKYVFAVPAVYIQVVNMYTNGESILPTDVTAPVGQTQPEHIHIFSFGWMDKATGKHQEYELTHVVGPTYTVELYLQQGAYKALSNIEWRALSALWQLRYVLIGALIGALALFVGTLIYLCFAAGHKPGQTAIAPGGLNRLPLDLYGAVAALLIALCMGGIAGCIHFVVDTQYHVISLVGIAVLCCGIALLLVGWIFAFAAQRKLGWRALFQRTLIGRVLMWCWRQGRKAAAFIWKAILQLIEVLPLVWQWLLAGVLFGLLLLISVNEKDELLLLITVIAYIGACAYGSYAFGQLLKQAKEMNNGDLSIKNENPRLIGCFKNFARQLNALSSVVSVAAREQMKSERMKAELITNVSHDLKTPLTSIINYVDLLQKAETPEQREEYLQVLSRQSQHMKKLVEDLMEMSKASSGNVTVELTKVDAAEAVNQALGEFADKLSAARLQVMLQLPKNPVQIQADGKLVWRVLNNLLGNVVKYALPDTRVYIDLKEEDNKAVLAIKNISKESLNITAEELMERFVRGDASRNTEGSGLGLNIARSLMELQNGQLTVVVDGDLFKVCLEFPLTKE